MKVRYKILFLFYLQCLSAHCDTYLESKYPVENNNAIGITPLKIIDYQFFHRDGNFDSSKSNKLLEKYKNNIEKKDYFYYKSWVMYMDDNYKERLSLLKKADQLGHMEAGEEIYEEMHVLGIKLPEAINFLESSANKGNSSAQFTLGVRLYNSIKQDQKKTGVLWLEKSALLGVVKSREKFLKESVISLLQDSSQYFWRFILFMEQNKQDSYNSAIKIISRIKNWPSFCHNFYQIKFDPYENGLQLNKETFELFEIIVDKCNKK